MPLAILLLLLVLLAASRGASAEIVAPQPTVSVVETATPTPDPTPDGLNTYVLNTNTKRFHKPTCSSVTDIKEKNRRDVEADRDELVAQGYAPCKRCKP